MILQSTTYPGTTEELVQPILEAASGLTAGVDFHLAYSPERVDPASTEWDLSNTAKICGGVTAACAEATRVLLDAMIGRPGLVTVVASPKVAEMAKLAENTYRAVNIAYVNELAVLAHAMDIDIWDVLDAAQTKPFGYQRFDPGIGPGGMCIPVNPHYLSFKAHELDVETRVIELTGDINFAMAEYVRDRVDAFLPVDGKRVLCLGAAFKAGVSDVRNSRAVRVMELLEDAGAQVDFADPLARVLTLRGTNAHVGRSRRHAARRLRPHRGAGAQPGVAARRGARRGRARVRRGERARGDAERHLRAPVTQQLAFSGSSRASGPVARSDCSSSRPRPVITTDSVRVRIPALVEAAPRARARGASACRRSASACVRSSTRDGSCGCTDCCDASASTSCTCTPPRSRPSRACSCACSPARADRRSCTPSTTCGRRTTS